MDETGIFLKDECNLILQTVPYVCNTNVRVITNGTQIALGCICNALMRQ